MIEKKSGVQEALDDFKKSAEELTRKMAAEKQNGLQIQIDNLRQDVKDLQSEAVEVKKPSAP